MSVRIPVSPIAANIGGGILRAMERNKLAALKKSPPVVGIQFSPTAAVAEFKRRLVRGEIASPFDLLAKNDRTERYEKLQRRKAPMH